jgi:putative MATE family efflux protein
MWAFQMLVGIGATALISISLGQKRINRAEKVLGNALTLTIIVAVAMTILGFMFMKPLLVLFGASPAVLPSAADYVGILLLGAIFGGISFGMANTIRAEGNPNIAMVTQIIAAICNIVLGYIFIFPLNLGIKGSALGVIIAQAISACFVIYYYYSGKSMVKLYLRNMRPDFGIIKNILSLGFPAFAMQLAVSVQQAILNRSVAYYGGDKTIAAVGIIFSVVQLLVMPIVGISQGAQPLIGYNYGAKQYNRVSKTVKYAIGAATILLCFGFLITRLFPGQILALFSSNDHELISIGRHGIVIFTMSLPVVGFQIISSNYFQAVGKSFQATILNLSRQVLIFIPLLLILPRYYGMEGVWLTAPIADFLAALIAGIWITVEMKNLKKEQIDLHTTNSEP